MKSDNDEAFLVAPIGRERAFWRLSSWSRLRWFGVGPSGRERRA